VTVPKDRTSAGGAARTSADEQGAPAATAPPDPAAILRSRAYVVMLVLGALVGVPVAVVAYFFLALVGKSQNWVFGTLPDELGLGRATWWPVVPLVLSGVIVALSITYLPGTGGHEPAEGLKTGGATRPIDLPGIVVASLATLCLGAVLGPEAPLIAIGSGLAVLAVLLVRRDAPQQAVMVVGAAGSFAAIATLLGSPLTGAFLLMEAGGLGALLGVVLVPGLLAAGIGALIFVGLDSWTGLGSFTLAVPDLPSVGAPTVAEFLWAVVIGAVAACLGALITRGARIVQHVVVAHRLLVTPVLGLLVALLAIAFEVLTDKDSGYVLFSGQTALPKVVDDASSWSVGALVLLIVCKSLAYSLSMSGFRGGPVFPGMFIGAALGIVLSHLPGLSMIAAVGIGIGAMTVSMLGLPLVSVLLPSLLLAGDAVQLMPLTIVGVVTSYVVSAHLRPEPTSDESPSSA
jgi:H+/Cl- antiporter ClcA